MSAAGFTPIQLYRSTTASAVPTAGNLADGELAINTNDGKLYYKDSSGVVQLMASKAGASGDVVGPASATDNAVVRFDGTTGKLVQNSVVTIADSTGDVAGVGALTMGGNLTLSGGTANGVLYLNGSKVATSGSALTFDGTNFLTSGNINAGLGKFLAFSASAASASNYSIYGDASTTVLNGPSGGVVQFNIANSEQMRLTSTGLGIGASSPTSKLEVAATNAIIQATGTTGWSGYSVTKTNGSLIFGLDDGATFGQSDGSAIIRNASGKGLYYYNSTTLRMVLDSSGNLGLATGKVTTSTAGTGAGFQWGGTTVTSRLYDDGSGNVYLDVGAGASNATVPLVIRTKGGSVAFNNGTSQTMTLDASGNLGVGETSIAADTRLHLKSAGDIKLKVETTNNTLASGNAALVLTTGSYGYSIQNLTTTAGSAGVLRFYDNTAAVERARITSGGDLLVGTTDAGATTGVGVKTVVSATIPAVFTVFNTAGGGNAYNFYNTNATNNGYRFYVKVDGGVANYQANDLNLSDIRKKTDIQLAGSYLDKICAIPVKTFLYKDQLDTERNLGVIAQDVDAVAPELVDRNGFGETPEGESPYLSIYQTDLQYALMKCIQEQQALITSLTARVALLEGN